MIKKEGLFQRISDNYSDNKREEEYIHFDRKKEYNMSIFGFNFNDLNTKYKYIIASILILFIFCSVLYGLKKINDLRSVNNNKKKEKKNKWLINTAK